MTWYAGPDGSTNWGEATVYGGYSAPIATSEKDVDWINHRVPDGKPTFNVVSLSFINPFNLLNQRTDAASTNGVPNAMVAERKNLNSSYVFFSMGGVGWASESYHPYFKQAVAQNATLLGQLAAKMANDYNVGIEIDNEDDTIDFVQLEAFIDSYRAHTNNWITMDTDAAQAGWSLSLTAANAVKFVQAGKLSWINAMVSNYPDTLQDYTTKYWPTWTVKDHVVVSEWIQYSCTKDATGFLPGIIEYVEQNSFRGISFWASGGYGYGFNCTFIEAQGAKFLGN